MGIDASGSLGALIISVLRVLHIVSGLLWVGAAFMLSFYIEPRAAGAGQAGDSFLRGLYRETNLPRLIPLSAAASTISGLLLYEMLAYSRALSSPMGLVLSAGAVFGLLAFLHGYFAVWRGAGRFASALITGGADEAELARMQAKLRRNGRVSAWLALVSLVLMASARYISPILA